MKKFEEIWIKQSLAKPLFEDLLWSKPENRRYAGKLLIIGGHKQSFNDVSVAYAAALKAGAGTVRVILPDSLEKMLSKVFPEAEFAPSTQIGSFSRQALDKLLESAGWADGVLLAGDFGRNSETAILLESFAGKYSGQLTIAGDGLDYYLHKNSIFFSRPETLAVIDFAKLQKLAINNRPNPPLKHSMNLHQMVEVLADWSKQTKIQIITNYAEQFVVASSGQVSTTPMPKKSNWQIELAAYASVWWLQQPAKPFEALITAVFDYLKS